MFIKYFNELWRMFRWVSVTITDKKQAEQFGMDISSVGTGLQLYTFLIGFMV